jgi:nitrite reductase/ring-hydroxylating ferredoxin subunit
MMQFSSKAAREAALRRVTDRVGSGHRGRASRQVSAGRRNHSWADRGPGHQYPSTTPQPAAEDDSDFAPMCGWHESSFDLRAGLCVTEVFFDLDAATRQPVFA